MNTKRIARLKAALVRESKHTAVGALGEQLAAELFSQDYTVQHNRPGQHRGDLTIIDTNTGESYHVEVKTTRRCKSDKKWHFQLWKDGKTDHRHSDYVLLIAVHITGDVTLFLVPCQELSSIQHTSMEHPDKYAGKFACYRKRGALTL